MRFGEIKYIGTENGVLSGHVQKGKQFTFNQWHYSKGGEMKQITANNAVVISGFGACT